MATAKKGRTSKVVVAGVTQEQFNEAFSAYALNDAEAAKLSAKLDLEMTRIREKYVDEFARLKTANDGHIEVMQTYCTENKQLLFSETRHIDSPHGKIGFRLGTPKLKTLPKWTWEKVLEKLQTVLPDYVRTKKEVDKESLIRDRETEAIAPFLNTVGIYVDQDDTFYVELKKEGE